MLSADIVADDFEARFSAIKRHYRYRITNHRANLAIDIKRSWRVQMHLTDCRMIESLDPVATELRGSTTERHSAVPPAE